MVKVPIKNNLMSMEEFVKEFPLVYKEIHAVFAKHKVPQILVPVILEWYKLDFMMNHIRLDGKIEAKLKEKASDKND